MLPSRKRPIRDKKDDGEIKRLRKTLRSYVPTQPHQKVTKQVKNKTQSSLNVPTTPNYSDTNLPSFKRLRRKKKKKSLHYSNDLPSIKRLSHRKSRETPTKTNQT
jgi:hypothetical protein